MDPSEEEIATSLMGQAKFLLERDKELENVIVFFNDEGTQAMATFDGSIDAAMVARTVDHLKSTAIATIAQAWAVQKSEYDPSISPSEAKDKQEIIMVVVKSTSGCVSMKQKYLRKDDGNVTFEGDVEQMAEAVFNFILDGVFNDSTATKH